MKFYTSPTSPYVRKVLVLQSTGVTLYDSRVICRFFDDRAGAGLYSSGARHWELLTLEATADGILDAALLGVYEERVRPEDKRFAPWADGQWAKIARALDALETRWMSHLSGPLNIGQIRWAILICATPTATGAKDMTRWPRGTKRLKRGRAWLRRFRSAKAATWTSAMPNRPS